MKSAVLRPGEPGRDFGQMAVLFSNEDDWPTTEVGLKEEYEREKDRTLLMAAARAGGELLGFYWATRSVAQPDLTNCYLIVEPGQRRQGVGRQLYDHLEGAATAAGARRLRVNVRDTCPEYKAFAEHCGFTERSHRIAMALNLETFDDRPYDALIARLKGEGFRFTSMEALGDTEEAQRKLYALNDATATAIPGSGGEHPWASFEDFRESVCHADWYKPGGQMVVIDTANDALVAMSAITRFEGNGVFFAYNLHTGVDAAFRGRKLAQAVKVTALRYARDVLQTKTVRTHHNSLNLPILAIDHKFGYVELPGTFSMEKQLNDDQ